MLNINKNDSRNIWVMSDDRDNGGGIGTYDSPLAGIADALKKVSPGQNIVLLPGIYTGDQTIEVSGAMKNPIYITAYKPGKTIINGGCWYFYDAFDLIVSNLTFKNSRRGAISIIGQCLRNRFHSINFVDCGTDDEASCTFYFGGTGGQCNIVDNCDFLQTAGNSGHITDTSATNAVATADTHANKCKTVALMISDGSEGAILENHVISGNRFRGYDKAIVLGTGNVPNCESWHSVERNRIENCGSDGITVYCKDVRLANNFISECASFGIVMANKSSASIWKNRISNCGGGMSVSGSAHTIVDNHMIECKSAAISVHESSADTHAAKNLLINQNHFVNCGTDQNAGALIIGANASGVITNNNFYGPTQSCVFKSPDNTIFAIYKNIEGIDIEKYVDDNNDEEKTDTESGGMEINDDYDDEDYDNYNNDSEHNVADIGDMENILDVMFNREKWIK